MQRLIPLVLFVAIAALGLLSEAGAGGLPSCKEQWQGKEHDYNFEENYEAFQKRLARAKCEKEWTVFVYMAADNNLFPYALWDLYEMEAAFKSKNVAGSSLRSDLVVQVDGPDKNDNRRLHIYSDSEEYEERTKDDFVGAKLDMVKSPVISRLNENEKKPEQKRFEDFLLWGAEKYPAKNYMIVVWGHGQGWKSYPLEAPEKSRFLERTELPKFPSPAPADKQFGGIAFSQSSKTWLDVPALSNALGTFQAKVGKPVDVYASDACLMQMLEVSYEISAHARFVVGSAQVQSFLGLPYRRLMYELNTGHFNGLRKENRPGEDGDDEAYLLAKMLPALMKQSLDPKRGLQGGPDKEAILSMTSSALTATELESQLVPELARLGSALKKYLLEEKSRILEIRFVTQNVPSIRGGAQDFGVFLGYLDQLVQEERARNGGELSPAAAGLHKAVAKTRMALDRAVLSYAYGTGYGLDKTTKFTGYGPRAVSIWLPVATAEYHQRRQMFLDSRLYRETRWQDWLDLIFPR